MIEAMRCGAYPIITDIGALAEVAGPNNASVISIEGEATSKGFKFHWYDGYINAKFDRDSWQLEKESDEYNHPDSEILDGMSFKDFGSVIIGEEGKLFFNRGKKNWVLKTSNKIDEFQWPDPSIARAREEDSYKEWMDAIKGKIEQSESNFNLAGPMTETILLGVLAQRQPNEKLSWDSQALKVRDRPDLSKWILAAGMLLGRLELFAVLVLFFPSFWRN